MSPERGGEGRSRASGALLVCWAVMTSFPIVSTSPAFGHAFRPGALTLVEAERERYTVTWQHPSGVDAATMVRPRLPSACRDVSEPTALGSELERWEIDCRPEGLRGAELGATGLDASGADVSVQVLWQSGSPFSAMLRGGEPTIRIPRTAPDDSAWIGAILATYVRLGIEHIWVGLDHLAFVTGLFLLATGRRRLVWTITAFTAAHSVSLALSIFDMVRVAPGPVEAVIALSVLLLARELACPDAATLTRRMPWLMAGAFGLVHGLGFAGALREIGVPPGRAAVALAGFNVGVEVGQLLFVAALAGCALLAQPVARRWPRLVLGPIYAMGIVAAVWTIGRVGAVGGWTSSAF